MFRRCQTLIKTHNIRFYSSVQAAKLSNIEYHKLSDKYLDSMTDYLEQICDTHPEAQEKEFDVLFSAGVLTLKLGHDCGTFVLNKQPPNKQIWLSSPISGPKRFDWIDPNSGWVYLRHGTRIKDLLDSELSKLLDTKIDTPL